MRKLGVWLVVFGVLNAPVFGSESLVRVPIASKWELLQMLGSGMDVVYVEPEGKFADLVADSSEILQLRFLGFSPFVAVSDLRAQGAGLLGASMGGYHTYAEVKAFLDSVAAARPDLVSPVFSIGQSLEGREIWGVKISNLPNGNDGRPEVLYTALTHAREPMSMEVLLYTIRHLLQNYGSDSYVTGLLNTRDLYFLPVLNPDGYLYNQATNPTGGGFWRKNRRPNAGGSFGVDLNRNFGYLWGLDNFGSSPTPTSETYRGTAPFSEPETQRLRDFVLSRNFTFEIDYHTYSNLWLFPWGYGTEPAEDYWLYRALADSAVLHNGYLPGPGWQLYLTNGTSIDWAYSAAPSSRIYSFTPEVGGPSDGFWPPASRIPALAAENLTPNLFYAWAADNPRKILPP
ncbi:MAG TPA: M14 family metallopeptidase, partial [candidate division Zixibacteria bacterium]|nr:M14 family metallopeptidase [candidate division Zixibacteria bacterium]